MLWDAISRMHFTLLRVKGQAYRTNKRIGRKCLANASSKHGLLSQVTRYTVRSLHASLPPICTWRLLGRVEDLLRMHETVACMQYVRQRKFRSENGRFSDGRLTPQHASSERTGDRGGDGELREVRALWGERAW